MKSLNISYVGVRALLSILAILLLSASTASAQAIAGRVTSADDGEPIAGALVVLLDEAANQLGQTETGVDGQYRIEVPAPGIYLIVIDNAGFANQMSTTLVVAEGATTSYDLSMTRQRVGESGAANQLSDADFLAQFMSETCAGTFIPGLHGILFGAVRNAGNGDPLAGIEVTVRWNERGYGQQAKTARSDGSGFYFVCDVPAGEDLQIRAQAQEANAEGPTQRIRMNAGTMRSLDIEIALSDPTQPGNLFGVVRDVDTNRPVIGARVRLNNADRTTLSNQRGNFTMRDVDSGLDVMNVEVLGYETATQAIQVFGGRSQQIEVLVSKRPLELDPILVTVRPRSWFTDRVSLEDRMAVGAGHFIMPEDIAARAGASNLGDLLRNVPGVRVRRSGGGVTGTYTVQLRQAANLANEACTPMIYMDGIPLGQDASAFAEILAFNLEVVEVYRGPAEVPGEFSGGNARCGVIVVWSSRGFGIGG